MVTYNNIWLVGTRLSTCIKCHFYDRKYIAIDNIRFVLLTLITKKKKQVSLYLSFGFENTEGFILFLTYEKNQKTEMN